MYTGLLHLHSTLRYVVLILLLIVLIKSLMGWLNKKEFTAGDGKLSLFLMIGAHTQLLIGLVLYFISPMVQSGDRYWKMEHLGMMLIAIVFITLARSLSKKAATDEAKHQKLFIFTLLAVVVIAAALVMSGRGLLGSTMMGY